MACQCTRPPGPARLPTRFAASGRRVFADRGPGAGRPCRRASDGDFTAACRADARLPRPRGLHRHGQVRAHRPQDRRDPGLHRHAGLLRAPGRSRPRRPGHDHRRRRRARAVLFRRERRDPDAAAGAQAPGQRADRDDRPAGLVAGARSRRAPGRQRAGRSLPARPGARPPAPPPRWRWATRWRSRCSKRAASPPTTSRARIRPARSAAACCCTSATSCTPATTCRACAPTPPLSEALVEMSRKRLGMTRDRRRRRTACSACSPTATCAARSTMPAVDLRATPIAAVMTRSPEDHRRRCAGGRGRAADGSAQDQRAAGGRRASAAWSARSTSTTCCARGWSDAMPPSTSPCSHLNDFPADIRERAARIRLACFDVDGTLTDGRLFFDSDGRETQGLPRARRPGPGAAAQVGIAVAFVTARASAVAERRAAELGLEAHTGVQRQARLRARRSPRAWASAWTKSPSWATTSPTCA